MEIALLALLLLVAVAVFVSVPLRRRSGGGAGGEDPELADLEARKEAKYREIRDAELDRAQGKIGEPEFDAQDAELRREAIEILKRIDELEGAPDRATEQADADR